jgi:asparagine synthase (glutamine-hydrolysing)
MAHALEARSPFLDHVVLELSARLPVRLKVRRTCTKRILRDAFSDLFPPELRGRPKMGFGVPLGAWLRGPLFAVARERLTQRTARIAGYLKADAVRRLLEEHRVGRGDHGKRIWSLLALEEWLRSYGVSG